MIILPGFARLAHGAPQPSSKGSPGAQESDASLTADASLTTLGLASLQRLATALSGWRAAPAGFPHLERLPQDLAWHAASFLTARELMRCGEACRAHAAVCLEAHEPWDALRRRLARAAGVSLTRRPDDAKTPPARLFFADARAMPDRVAASAAADACVLVVDGRALDVTAFLDQHPGGGELLTEFRGRDASLAFDEVGHSFFARAKLDAYVVFAPERFVGGRLPPRRRNRSAGDERKTLLRYGFARSRMRGDG